MVLLHFDEVFDLDRDKLLVNPQVTAKRRYAEHELRKLLPGYSKGKYNAEKFCQDENLLSSEVGTNVAKLILLMKDQKKESICY